MRLKNGRPVWTDAKSAAEAVEIQRKLADRVFQNPFAGEIEFVAGADVHSTGGGKLRAVVSVLSFPSLEVVEDCFVETSPRFPYVPGLLSFREAPPLLECFKKLKTWPQAALFDGQGVAHPRRFGLASHLGVLLDLPSIGCAKSRLFGACAEPDDKKGAKADILDGEGRVIGAVLRTRENVRPVYVSLGHKVSLGQAVAVVMACVTRYRIPEPLRRAHGLAKG
ncbi:MAG: endonuclease V [Nitrospinae bacterium]|nr:endonuclease V [Nitrospinota bacterium]